LPFTLTEGQRKAAWEILLDIAKPSPMNRILEGDVGSGKTVVAAIAALNCMAQHSQVVLMAPTEILAHQHFKTISKILPQKYTLAMVTGSTSQLYSKKLRDFMPISRQKLQKRLLEGSIDIVIGTHALISKKAESTLHFGNLGLAIVDEQHRFGVEQRARLIQKKSGAIPHFLSMTATPIPRTLALTVFGDLDISILGELPSGRKKIETKIVTPQERNSVYQLIEQEIKNGRQAFVVCPLIEESEKLQVAAATKEFEKLKTKVFPHLSIGLLHGKMKPKEKQKALEDFKEKKTHILVTTPVVEVGIDVPNATIMAIEGPERFGLAQLHQFRGRVGRAEHQSYCFLLAESPTARLRAMATSSSGFELAQKDLELRGPGDFYGTRQWGVPDLVMANIGDMFLVQSVRQEALTILKQNPTLSAFPSLQEKTEEIEKNLHLE
jgi:ATP-dependent DNA helicase RecG